MGCVCAKPADVEQPVDDSGKASANKSPSDSSKPGASSLGNGVTSSKEASKETSKTDAFGASQSASKGVGVVPKGTYVKKAQKDTRRSRLSLEPEDDEDAVEEAAIKPYIPADSQSVLSMLSESESKAQFHEGSLVIASVSRKGYVPYSKQPNQDRELVQFAVQGDPEMILLAVMDGHGKYGHRVAEYVKTHFVRHLENQPDLKRDPKTSITKAVKDMADELQAAKPIDLSFSGTTALFVLKIKNNLFVANIGDARAVVCVETLGQGNQAARIEGFPISQEHVPSNETEAARIKKAGGRIKTMEVANKNDDPGPLRVWLKETEAPGLTMTRAIGDEVAQTVGVIAVPQIWQYEIQDSDILLILGTDGLFKFMSNDDVCKIAYTHRENLVVACKLLTREAKSRWQEREEISDDITMVIADLRPSSAATAAAAARAAQMGSANSLHSSGTHSLKPSKSTESQPRHGQLSSRNTLK